MGKRTTLDTGQGAERKVGTRHTHGLQSNDNLVQAITQVMPDLVNIYDAGTGTLIYGNQEQLERGKVRGDETKPVDWIQMGHYTIDPEENHRVVAFKRRRLELRDDEILETEFRVIDTSGNPGWIRMRSKIFKKDRTGKPLQIISFTTNITEKKNAELQLEKSKEELARRATDKYQTLFNSIDEGYALCELIQDAEGRAIDARYLEVNPAFEQSTGLQDAAGRTAREVNPEIEPIWRETPARVIETGQPARLEEYSPSLGRWFDIHYSRVGSARDRTFALILNNITERKRRERQQEFLLKLSDALRPLANPAEIQGQAARILGESVNAAWTYYGEYDNPPVHMTIHADYRSGNHPSLVGTYPILSFDMLKELVQGRTMAVQDTLTSSLISEGSRARWGRVGLRSLIAVPIVKDGILTAALIVADTTPRDWSDVRGLAEETAERTWAASQRARAEQARQEAHADLEQRVAERTRELGKMSSERQVLLQELLSAQEAERRRISRELHDQLGQRLTALSLELQALKREHRTARGLARRVVLLEDMLKQTAETVQSLAFELRPSALDDLGLATTLQNYLEDWAARFDLDVQCQMTGLESVRLPAGIEIALYRIMQEALTNIVRHAAATHVSVILDRREGQAIAIIEDDGRGFDLEQVIDQAGARRPLGLIGMRERAALVGGTVEIESSPDAGTTIFVRIPLGSES